jgi:diguanylate cyclase (GGDEF)-like protein
MTAAPLPPDESLRQQTLNAMAILDTPAEHYLDTLVRVAQRMFGVESALISLIDHDRQWFKARIGMAPSETPRNDSFCSHAILETSSLIVENALEDPRFRDIRLVTEWPKVRFYAGHSIRIDRHAIGTLCLMDSRPRDFSDTERAQLEDMAMLAEGYLQLRSRDAQIRKLSQSLDHERRKALMDPLTQCWNRAGLEHFFSAKKEHANTSRKQLGVLYCDIDCFKSINDRYGHATGDQVLVECARRLRGAIREDDLLVRQGGEEFVVLVQVENVSELYAFADRVRLKIASAPVSENSTCIQVTLSIGYAITHPDETLKEVVTRADQALYRAKRNGRNRVESAESGPFEDG